MIALGLTAWEEFVRCQVRGNDTYSEAKRQFSSRNRDDLMNAQSPHKWCFTLKSPVFGREYSNYREYTNTAVSTAESIATTYSTLLQQFLLLRV